MYERVAPAPPRKPGFQSLLFTQLISAVWHGLYPGYLLFFTGTAVWIYFSQVGAGGGKGERGKGERGRGKGGSRWGRGPVGTCPIPTR